MSKLRNRVIAFTLSVLTALSTVAGSLPAYADTIPESPAAVGDSSEEVTKESTEAVINLRVDSMGGSLIVNEGQTDEQTITVDENGKTVIRDANGYETVASVTEEQPYDLILKEEPGTTVNVKAVSNDGYQVSLYAVSTDSGAQDVGFTPCQTFTYDVVADGTKTIEADFQKAEEETSSESQDASENTEAAESDIVFSSARLLVGTSSEAVVAADNDKILSSYDGVYLIQYASEKDAKAAYEKYKEAADFVDVDTAEIEAADDADIKDVSTEEMTEDANPIASLAQAVPEAESRASSEDTENNIIAVIDTGASVGGNVIDAVSMLGEDAGDDNGHGTEMVKYITTENPDAKILSIKALDKNGKGTPSSVYAAIKYAMERKAGIINLSLSGVKKSENSAIADIIEEAADAGISVVGAAGNDNADAKYMIPGSIRKAHIIGACFKEGVKRANSNYGDTVDFYVTADSTSEAAARFTGLISKGILEPDNKTFFYSCDVQNLNKKSDAEIEKDLEKYADSSSDLSTAGTTVNPAGSIAARRAYENKSSKKTLTDLYKKNGWETAYGGGICKQH